MMLFWLIYDISENKTRNKIVSLCKNYGLFRVQKSSFIGKLTKNRAEMILIDIKNLELKKGDCVFLIPTCKSCFSDKLLIGELNEEKLSDKSYTFFENDS